MPPAYGGAPAAGGRSGVRSALGEAMAVHTTLFSAEGEAALDELYVTEGAQASVLERMGRTAEAARVADPARSRHLDGVSRFIR